MVENPIKVFFSDLHSHCRYSDGVLLPAVAHEYARDVCPGAGTVLEGDRRPVAEAHRLHACVPPGHSTTPHL